MTRPRTWKALRASHANPPQACTSKYGEALVWRNSDGGWFVSVGTTGATEADAKELGELLLDTLRRCKKGA